MNKILNMTVSVAVVAAGLASVFAPQAFAVVNTCTWTGAGADAKFSTVANWTNCNGAAPVAGDIISFNASMILSDKNKLVNDLGVDLGGVVANNDTVSGQTGFANEVFISQLSIADGGYISTPMGSYGITLGVYVGDGTNWGTLIGKGSLEFRGYSTSNDLDVAGTLKISRSGTDLSPNRIFLNLTSPNKIAALEISDYVAVVVGNQSKDVTTVNTSVPIIVRSGAKAEMYFNSACAEFAQWGSGTGAGCLQELDTTHNYTGALTLEDKLTINTDLKTTVNLTGAISNKDNVVRGPVVGTLNIGGVALNNPVVTNQLDGAKDTEEVSVVQNQTAALNQGAVRSSAYVYAGGVLKGTGSLKYGIYVYDGGKIAPGMSPGCLTSNTLFMAGEYQFELGGTTACSGYDQIKVLGQSLAVSQSAVKLGGTGSDTATLSTLRFNGYTPKQGEVYVIIDNQSTKAIEGTFKGLAEGATFNQDGVVYKISYVGGDGNDVTLTVMNQPTVPNTGFGVIKANPVATAVVTAVAALALVVLGRRLQTARK